MGITFFIGCIASLWDFKFRGKTAVETMSDWDSFQFLAKIVKWGLPRI